MGVEQAGGKKRMIHCGIIFAPSSIRVAPNGVDLNL
jgi:hypothetical protein